MNKEAFIRRLRELLAGLPQNETAEAIQYYEDYFADAGEENEAKVMEELGSPEKVAANIRADLGMAGSGSYAGDGGNGYAGDGGNGHAGDGGNGCAGDGRSGRGAYRGGYDTGDRYTGNAQSEEGRYNGSGKYNNNCYDNGGNPPKEKHTMLWILLAVFTCYIWIPLLFAALILVFAAVIVICALSFAFGVTALAIGITGIALIGMAIVKMFISPAGGLVLLGGGLVITGVTIIFIWLVCMLFGRALPAFFRGIGRLGRRARKRGGEAR